MVLAIGRRFALEDDAFVFVALCCVLMFDPVSRLSGPAGRALSQPEPRVLAEPSMDFGQLLDADVAPQPAAKTPARLRSDVRPANDPVSVTDSGKKSMDDAEPAVGKTDQGTRTEPTEIDKTEPLSAETSEDSIVAEGPGTEVTAVAESMLVLQASTDVAQVAPVTVLADETPQNTVVSVPSMVAGTEQAPVADQGMPDPLLMSAAVSSLGSSSSVAPAKMPELASATNSDQALLVNTASPESATTAPEALPVDNSAASSDEAKLLTGQVQETAAVETDAKPALAPATEAPKQPAPTAPLQGMLSQIEQKAAELVRDAPVQHVPVTAARAEAVASLRALPLELGLQILRGNKEFTVRLDPAELGKVEVKLSTDEEGVVQAKLTVDRVDTLYLLQRDARTLERAFDQAGLKTSPDALQFQLRGDGNAQQQRDGEAQSQAGRGSAGPSDQTLDIADLLPKVDLAAIRFAASRARGGVDLAI
jgi:flagellar hook-length control protein FliK